jgi:hypothetical protein
VTAPTRFFDTRQSRYSFADEAVVVCPRCRERALVHPVADDASLPNDPHFNFRSRGLTCARCGLTRRGNPSMHYFSLTHPIDAYFGTPLWLVTPVRGEMLWAYNARHLDFIEEFVRATLRERRAPGAAAWVGYANKSLASRMPLWMKRGANREAILAGCARLRERAR